MITVLFSLFLNIYGIFTDQIKYQKFDLESGQEVDKLDLRLSIANVRFYIGGIFQNVRYLKTYVCAKIIIIIHTLAHAQREAGLLTTSKICKADLPKNGLRFALKRLQSTSFAKVFTNDFLVVLTPLHNILWIFLQFKRIQYNQKKLKC